MSNDRAPRQRLFFALWPDDAVHQKLAEIVRGLPRCVGRFVPTRNLHITLAFAGVVDARAHACLVTRALQIEAEAFSLRLTRIGYFRRSRILWLGADASPAALITLARQLNLTLEYCGLRPDFKPYRPHITLAREAAPPSHEAEVALVDWRVDVFCLVVSHTRPNGAHYKILQRFKLHS